MKNIEKLLRYLPLITIVLGVIAILIFTMVGRKPNNVEILGVEFDLQQNSSNETVVPSPTAIPFDVYDDFLSSTLSTENWQTPNGEISLRVQNGGLEAIYDLQGDFGGAELSINNHGHPLRTLATEFTVKKIEPSSYVFLAIHLGKINDVDTYAHFGMIHTGEVFFLSSLTGEIEQTWASNGINEANVLTINWTEQEVRFYVNEQLVRTVQAKDGGYWANIGFGAENDSGSTTEFDWVGWVYR